MQVRTSHWILALAAAAGLIAADSVEPARIMMEAARKKEVVDGDLNGAIKQYAAIVSKYKSDRAVTAMALVRMAECYQKMGDAEARKIYEQVVREYGDQKDAVAEARAHLGAAAAKRVDAISSRRIWTAPAKADFYGQVSPDGRYIPYTNWSDNGNLFVHDTVTGTERRLTDTADDRTGGSGAFAEESAFSRDSKQLAYTWDPGKNAGVAVELRVMSLQGDAVPQPRRLVVNKDLKWISPYSWSPDGKSIAVFLQRQDRTGQFAVVSVDDGSLRVLKSVDWRFPAGVFFSPDGKYLAYDTPANDTTGQRDVFVIAADGSREVPAVLGPSRDSVVGWSADGKRLIFASDRSGPRGLWALPFADGQPHGDPELLKSDMGQQENLGMTTSGALYSAVYDPGAVPADVYVAPFDSAAGKFLSKPVPAAQSFLGTNLMPVWSPDGKSLAYVSMRRSGDEGHVVIGIRSTQTGQVRELVPSPNFPPSGGYFYSLVWMPDGNSFIVTGRGDKHGFGVFRIDAQTGQTSLIEAANARAAVPSPDGKTIYYRAAKDGDAILVKHDLASGEDQELDRAKYFLGGVVRSRVGRYVAIVATDDPRGNPSTVRVIPTAGGATREFRQPGKTGLVVFSWDDRYVLIGTQDPAAKSNSLLLIPMEGGEPREIMRAAEPQVIGFAGWMPDGKSFFVKKSSPKFEQSELWRLSLDGSAPQKLDTDVNHIAFGFMPSPDGQHVAFMTPRSEKKPAEIWVTENFLPSLTASK